MRTFGHVGKFISGAEPQLRVGVTATGAMSNRSEKITHGSVKAISRSGWNHVVTTVSRKVGIALTDLESDHQARLWAHPDMGPGSKLVVDTGRNVLEWNTMMNTSATETPVNNAQSRRSKPVRNRQINRHVG